MDRDTTSDPVPPAPPDRDPGLVVPLGTPTGWAPVVGLATVAAGLLVSPWFLPVGTVAFGIVYALGMFRTYLRSWAHVLKGRGVVAGPHSLHRDEITAVQVKRSGDRWRLHIASDRGVMEVEACRSGLHLASAAREVDAWRRRELSAHRWRTPLAHARLVDHDGETFVVGAVAQRTWMAIDLALVVPFLAIVVASFWYTSELFEPAALLFALFLLPGRAWLERSVGFVEIQMTPGHLGIRWPNWPWSLGSRRADQVLAWGDVAGVEADGHWIVVRRQRGVPVRVHGGNATAEIVDEARARLRAETLAVQPARDAARGEQARTSARFRPREQPDQQPV